MRSCTICRTRAPSGSRPAPTPRAWCSLSRTPARSSPHTWSPRLSSRFSAAANAYAPTTQASASAWRSSRASPKPTTEPSPSPPGPPAGSASRCNSPPRHRTLAGGHQATCRTPREHNRQRLSISVSCGVSASAPRPACRAMSSARWDGPMDMTDRDPVLQPFDALIGTWSTEAKHRLVDEVVTGTVSFEWLEGGHFVVLRSHNDHELFPDAISVIGAPESGEGLVMEYFDSRGVRRTYGVSLDDGVLRWWRDHPGFAQRFAATPAHDTFEGLWQLARTPGDWQDDLRLTYRRQGG